MKTIVSLFAIFVTCASFNSAVAGERQQFDPEQARQRMLTRVKESLGATDEEWKTLLPKVEAVQKAQSATRGGGLGFMSRRRGGGEQGNQPGEAKAEPRNDVEKKTQELQALVDNKDADAEAIKAKMAELREAREKAKAELKKTQDDLKQGLTSKQEALLIMQGILE